METITEHKIKLVDERHKIKHKETEKPRMAMETRKLWKEADEVSGKGGSSTTGGAKQIMNQEELTKHLKDKSIKSIQEWIERLKIHETAARDNSKRREKSEKTKTNLERVEEERAKQAAATKQKRGEISQAITEWLKRQEEEEEKEDDKAEQQQGGGGKRRKTNGESDKEKETQPAQPARTATPKRGPPTPPPASGGGPASRRGGEKRPRAAAASAVAGRRRTGGQKGKEGKGRKRGGEKTREEEKRRKRGKSGEGEKKGRKWKGVKEGEEESIGEGGGEEVEEEEREAEDKGD